MCYDVYLYVSRSDGFAWGNQTSVINNCVQDNNTIHCIRWPSILVPAVYGNCVFY